MNKISKGSNDISGEEITALIAVVVFVILIIFLALVLYRVSQIISKIEDTIDKTSTTIRAVTNDANALSRQVEGLFARGNEPLTDVDQKVAAIDLLFTAIADSSEGVFELNTSGKHLVTKVGTVRKDAVRTGLVGKADGSAFKAIRSKNKKTDN